MVLSGAGAARGPVVVTGADGFAGRAACARLRAAGVPLRGLVRALSPATVARPDVMATGDLATADAATLANALRGADVVVHLAGRAHVMRETQAHPRATFRAVNVMATARLARAAASVGAAHFVFASTVKVNGEATLPGRPFREGDPPDPRDDYAASKWEAECALADIARETGLAVTILRLPLMYGPGAKGNVARLAVAVSRGIPLPLKGLVNRRSLLGAGNFASALEAVVAHAPPRQGTVAMYFVADVASVATPELVRAMAKAEGVAPRLFGVPPALLRAACACVGRAAAYERLAGTLEVDTSAFRAALAWQPPFTLEEELAAMARAGRAPQAPPL